MGVAPGGSNPRPEGSLSPSGLQELASYDEAFVRRQALTGITAAAEGARSGFVAGLRESIAKPLQQIFAGLKPPGWEPTADAFHDGQLDMKNQLTLLSPLLDYGAAYMDSVGGFLKFGLNHGAMPFTRGIGELKNCELHDGGIRLLEEGMWDIRCMITISNNAINVGSGKFEWQIAIYRPDGTLYSKQRSLSWNVREYTSLISTSVVVPEPGYVAKAEVAWIHGSREIYGGPTNNRLIVQHISRGVGGGYTGAEDSYEPDIPDQEVTP